MTANIQQMIPNIKVIKKIFKSEKSFKNQYPQTQTVLILFESGNYWMLLKKLGEKTTQN